jgi:hypothetical protein
MHETIPAEQQETAPTSLSQLIQEMEQVGIKPLAIEEIKNQLEKFDVAILTHDYVSGIRLTRRRFKDKPDEYIVSTTNGLEDPENLLRRQFSLRKVTL